MKIITAMDSFKGSLSSNELNQIISDRIHEELGEVEIIQIPIADGGEGFLDSLASLEGYSKEFINVSGPLHRQIETEYLLSYDKKIAVIESAKIIGLNLVEELLPLEATSYGLGQVIKDAIDKGAKEINIGLGGSATNDAGIGILKALGFKFHDINDEIIDLNLNNIHQVNRIDSQSINVDLANIKFNAITDVKNIFTGSKGATHVFGEQKGLSEEDRKSVDLQLNTFREIILKQYGIDLNEREGTGAAGGISGIMLAFFNSKITPGIDYVLDQTNFNDYCKDSDYVITGEGRIDDQTFYGKVIEGIVNRADLYNVPVIAIGGSVEIEKLRNVPRLPIIFSIINTPLLLEDAMRPETTKINLNFTIKNICHLINPKHTNR